MSPKHEPHLGPSRMEDGKGTWLVVRLGNPGIEYIQTHHNCGYMVTDRSIENVRGKYRNQNLRRGGTMTKVADIRLGYGIDAPQVIVAHTGTYMNTSGPVVGQLLRFRRIDTAYLVVVHDNINLGFRCAKLEMGGSNGGHDGLKSIQQTLEAKGFARLRVGVGRPPSRELGGDTVDWVLGRFPRSKKADLREFFDRAV